ncbi:MAG: CHRD domain-containing protein [Planctomycetota bacterium]
MKILAHLASVAVITLTASAAQGAIVQYAASLTGSAEAPPNSSPATGYVTFDFDTVTHLFTTNVSFSGLSGTTTAAHIHADTAVAGTGTAGVASGLAGFPTGLATGSYTSTIDLLSAASYGAAYLAAHGGTAASAETDLLAAMGNGRAYLNVHSTSFPGGEIRGFISLVPAPGMLPLLGMCGVLACRRRR